MAGDASGWEAADTNADDGLGFDWGGSTEDPGVGRG